ncbi:MAG TPA: hypothetical protein VLH75_09500 [Longimicrobiales bacterium]|nr:hypothetical protein [Longimicrobiales bacterium]
MAERSKEAVRGRLARTRRRRRQRAAAGAVAALIVAGAIGLVVGRGSGTLAPEQAARAESAAALDRAVSKEVNRVLLELWKMESMEVRP